MEIKSIIAYGLIGMMIGLMIWLINVMVIIPMLISYYVRTKKEPSKIVAWFLFKTTSPTMLVISSMIWYLVPVLWKSYRRNKKRKKHYAGS